MTTPPASTGLRRVLRTRDVVLFYVVSIVGMRWVAVAAGAGPSSLTVWVIGVAVFFVPMAFAVLELSSRYPQEGGIYVWTRQAFGEFAGFMTGWTYWGSNLTYLPGLLYFTASTALYLFGSRYASLQTSGGYFIAVALLGLALAASLNIVGLQFAKWLNNVGAICIWIALGTLIVLGIAAGLEFGPATTITASSLLPGTQLKQLVFAATIAFGLGGIESGSFFGDEIETPRRTVPMAIAVAGIIIAALYVLGTLAVLFAVPQSEVSGLTGIMDAITAAATRVGVTGIGPFIALLVVVSTLGGVSAWLAAPARLPFVAGIDHFLPSAFGRLHPRYGTPYVALTLQAVVAGVCAILGQAGESPKRAYEILVSLGIISYFLPYLAMFAALIKLQGETPAKDVLRVPGGRPVAIGCGLLGVTTSLAAIALAAVPPDGEAHAGRYVVKVVGLSALLVLSGAITFATGRSKSTSS